MLSVALYIFLYFATECFQLVFVHVCGKLVSYEPSVHVTVWPYLP